MKFPNFLLILLAFLSLSSFHRQQTGNEWVYEQSKKGIKVFTKKSKWGHLRDARAVMQVAKTPDEMMKLLTDFDNYHTWMPRCSKSRMVARLSDNEFIAHLHFEAPWPVKDRDCVVRVKVVKDSKNGSITITQTSEPKYLKAENDVVRIEQLVSTWKLIPKNGGTEVVNEYASNPGGNIPDWMVNTESVDQPMQTFENLQQKVNTTQTAH
ncbi:MAG: SRPBCC family protein [Bacteroidetes bacterium]|nr:SRPBCC family protein [Bacteroidota bacterium]